LVETWIPPSRSETADIGKKTEGILGVKMENLILLLYANQYRNVFPNGIYHNTILEALGKCTPIFTIYISLIG
jgi:hypothetical protein